MVLSLTLAIQVRNEIEVLKRVSMGHQNILTLVDFFETMNNRKPGTFQFPIFVQAWLTHYRQSTS